MVQKQNLYYRACFLFLLCVCVWGGASIRRTWAPCLFSFLNSHFLRCSFHFNSDFLYFIFLAFLGQIAGSLGKIVSMISWAVAPQSIWSFVTVPPSSCSPVGGGRRFPCSKSLWIYVVWAHSNCDHLRIDKGIKYWWKGITGASKVHWQCLQASDPNLYNKSYPRSQLIMGWAQTQTPGWF